MYQPSKVAVKISSKSNIRKPVKTLPVLQVHSWSLQGHGGSWWPWRWCHMTCINHLKLLWNFIQIQHQKACQDSTCPPSPFLESLRTWRFLMNLEMVSDHWEHPYELSKRLSSRANIYTTHSKLAIFIGKNLTHKQTNSGFINKIRLWTRSCSLFVILWLFLFLTLKTASIYANKC